MATERLLLGIEGASGHVKINNSGIESEEVSRNEVEELRREIDALRAVNLRDARPVNLRDIEDSLPEYDGTDKYPVDKWITDIEENCSLFGWTELQQLICAKKLLIGTAKIWLEAQPIIKSWQQFKSLLVEEFDQPVNSALIHEELRSRKNKNDENYQEYILIMQKIAKKGAVEEKAIIQYIIDGIHDQESNKVILYEAENLKELKKKMGIYELMKNKIKNQPRERIHVHKTENT